MAIADKIAELLLLATEEGIELPYSAETIAKLEETGAVVDLLTGEIKINEADRARFSLTPYGEAWAHLDSLNLL